VDEFNYRRAARALSAEWDEWTSAAEAHFRGELIDNDLGGGGAYVEQSFAINCDTADEKWLSFLEYLADQRSRHTQLYDPAADRAGCVGEEILHIVVSRGSAPLHITQKEVREFRSGLRRRIKNDTNNPFRNSAIVKRAVEISNLLRQ
jgi:hypothetical protein